MKNGMFSLFFFFKCRGIHLVPRAGPGSGDKEADTDLENLP